MYISSNSQSSSDILRLQRNISFSLSSRDEGGGLIRDGEEGEEEAGFRAADVTDWETQVGCYATKSTRNLSFHSTQLDNSII